MTKNVLNLHTGRTTPLPSIRSVRNAAERSPLMIRKRSLFLTVMFACIVVAPLGAQTSEQAGGRWSAQRANDWYAKQPWLVGANFIPSDAINELEMFQSETFNPALIDKELGLGESIGMNTMRVFLQDQLWQQDAQGFTKRLDTFLGIAAKH